MKRPNHLAKIPCRNQVVGTPGHIHVRSKLCPVQRIRPGQLSRGLGPKTASLRLECPTPHGYGWTWLLTGLARRPLTLFDPFGPNRNWGA